jgi:hypothetical protein
MTTPKRREVMARAQAALRRRERERGIVRVLVKVHMRRRPELEALLGDWMLEDLAPPQMPPDVEEP